MKNKYRISHDMKTVSIYVHHKSIGTVKTIIDYENFDDVNSINTTWFVSYKNGRIDGIKTKVQRNKERKVIWLHRLITHCPCDKVVDHRNGDTLDNRRSNLRVVTSNENATNLSSISNYSRSGLTNIYLEADGKYRVRIKGISFGRYNNKSDAKKVRDNRLKKIFELRER